MWGKLISSDGRITYPLDKPSMTIGSDATCGVVLHDPSVAGQHARLTYSDGYVDVEDLGSRTGTLVAGTAVKPGKPFRILQAVEVDVGAVTLKFEFGERPALLPPSGKSQPAKKPAPGKPPAKGAGAKSPK